MAHFTTITDFSLAEIQKILDLSNELQYHSQKYTAEFVGKNILFCFEKPSFRTLVGTEAAINQLGGSVIHTTPKAFLGKVTDSDKAMGLGAREALKDTVRVAEKFCDAIFVRVFSHSTITALSSISKIPIVNALCDDHHPCQAMADMLTMQNHFGKTKRLKVAFVGDGNNVAFSLGQISLMLGHEFSWAGPEKYSFEPKEIASLEMLARKYGGTLNLVKTAEEAVKNASAVHADTWVSMGEESEYQQKASQFEPFQVNTALMAKASPEAIFMHCLPAHRGEEVTSEVMDGPQSVIYEQAKNRMVTSKGIFHYLLNA
ncbi:MAG: ornithine carbamoyltransferase [Chitinophagales bacterium]